MSPPTDHLERLWPPPSWWLLGLLATASAYAALAVSTPGPVVAAGTGGVALLVFGGLVAAGRTRVGVRAGEVVAGRAHVPLGVCASVEALDANQSRRIRGVDADARAFLLLRPYLPLTVRVQLADPADPTPYWLLSTRRPDRLVRAVESARTAPPVRRDDPRTAR